MPEYLTPNGHHNVDYTHNPYVRQTVQSSPSNNILNIYTTRRDYMAYLRKQKSPWNHWQKIFGNYLGNFKANLTKIATKMQKSFDDNNRVSGPNYQPQKATKTTTQIKNWQHIRMTDEGVGNGSNKHLRENLNGSANNVKNFFNYIGKGARNFGNSVMDALELRDSQKQMREMMAKGHQAAKKVRNYLKNPEKEKHRGQNKAQDPEFLQGFSNFIHHPREVVHKAAHQAKYGFTALQDCIARFNKENNEPNSPQKGIDFETLQTPENGVNLEGRADTSTPVKSGDVAPTVPHVNVPRLNNTRGPVVETHVSADTAANYEELAQQDAQRDYLEQQAQEAEPEELQRTMPKPQDEYVQPKPEQSKLDERNDRKIEAHKMRKQANENTTPVNNTPNEPNANMDSLENNIPPENDAPDEYVQPKPEQSKFDERNDRKIEAHKMRKQANKNTTPVNNTPNEPNANMASLEDNIPPENDVPLEYDAPSEPEPDPEPDF